MSCSPVVLGYQDVKSTRGRVAGKASLSINLCHGTPEAIDRSEEMVKFGGSASSCRSAINENSGFGKDQRHFPRQRAWDLARGGKSACNRDLDCYLLRSF